MIDGHRRRTGPAWLALIAAYGLLAAIWLSLIAFSHTYGHWLEGVDRVHLPALSRAVLPLLGLAPLDHAAAMVPAAIALALIIWPALGFGVFVRGRGEPARFGQLALILLAWLAALAAGLLMLAIGLWLPFSLL